MKFFQFIILNLIAIFFSCGDKKQQQNNLEKNKISEQSESLFNLILVTNNNDAVQIFSVQEIVNQKYLKIKF